MGKIDALLRKLCAQPTPANFRYSDLRTILTHFGYIEFNKGATSGSRVKYYHPETKAAIMLHKPHPGDEMVESAVNSVVIFLKEHGHI